MTISLLFLFVIFIKSNDVVHKLVQLQVCCMLAGNGEQIWHIDNVFICFLGKMMRCQHGLNCSVLCYIIYQFISICMYTLNTKTDKLSSDANISVYIRYI